MNAAEWLGVDWRAESMEHAARQLAAFDCDSGPWLRAGETRAFLSGRLLSAAHRWNERLR